MANSAKLGSVSHVKRIDPPECFVVCVGPRQLKSCLHVLCCNEVCCCVYHACFLLTIRCLQLVQVVT